MKKQANDLILEKKPTGEKIGSEETIRKMNELAAYTVHSRKEGYLIESFIVGYQLMQEMFLSDLTKAVLHKLGLEKIENKFMEESNAYNVNLKYVALTHDIELFELLEKARKMRNEIVHQIVEDETLELSKNKAKEAIVVVGDLIRAIADRLQGKKAIPVLTLYTKGWNDGMDHIAEMFKQGG